MSGAEPERCVDLGVSSGVWLYLEVYRVHGWIRRGSGPSLEIEREREGRELLTELGASCSSESGEPLGPRPSRLSVSQTCLGPPPLLHHCHRHHQCHH